jgi:kynurenine formamidase
MLEIGADRIAVVPHGVAHTHLDSLAHWHDNGVFYNGYKPDADSVMKTRHARNSVINLKNGIFTRGVLVDVPRLKNIPYLEPGTPIYAADIQAWEKMAHVTIGPGDAVFLRTCRWTRRDKVGPFDQSRTGKRSGPAASFALVYLGVHVFDNFDLEALAEAAQARKRWEFLLTVAPLAIRGGTGSPVNPIAVF